MVWVIWAESASRDTSPSLLLGYALLTSRAESALFLRMATGFGFAQVRRPRVSQGSVCPCSMPPPHDVCLLAALLITSSSMMSACRVTGAQRHAMTQAMTTVCSDCAESHDVC